MNLLLIPKWLLAISAISIAILMVTSYLTGSPFLIHGKEWGFRAVQTAETLRSADITNIVNELKQDTSFVKHLIGPEGRQGPTGASMSDEEIRQVVRIEAKNIFETNIALVELVKTKNMIQETEQPFAKLDGVALINKGNIVKELVELSENVIILFDSDLKLKATNFNTDFDAVDLEAIVDNSFNNVSTSVTSKDSFSDEKFEYIFDLITVKEDSAKILVTRLIRNDEG